MNLKAIAEALGVPVAEVRADGTGGATRSPRRMSLYDCQRNFEKWDAGQKGGYSLAVDVLTIDLGLAWPSICASIKKSVSGAASFRILMLTDEPDRLAPGELSEVREWAE